MSNPLPLDKPANLNWDPASVELPEIPMLPPGEDAMSMTIAAVLPTLTAPLTASVVALQAKETTFAGKLGAAESAYQNADESGSQSVGQMSSMLGQLGQMAQQAGAPAQALGGQTGTFGSMMQQAMQAAQGSGSPASGASDPHWRGAVPSGGQAGAGPGQVGAGAAQPPQSQDPSGVKRDDAAASDEREKDGRAASAGAAGPVPVGPPEGPRPGGDDLARRM